MPLVTDASGTIAGVVLRAQRRTMLWQMSRLNLCRPPNFPASSRFHSAGLPRQRRAVGGDHQHGAPPAAQVAVRCACCTSGGAMDESLVRAVHLVRLRCCRASEAASLTLLCIVLTACCPPLHLADPQWTRSKSAMMTRTSWRRWPACSGAHPQYLLSLGAAWAVDQTHVLC